MDSYQCDLEIGCYKIYNDTDGVKNWTEAQKVFQMDGADLLDINDQKEDEVSFQSERNCKSVVMFIENKATTLTIFKLIFSQKYTFFYSISFN